jgi:hypothetical protein
MGRFRPYFNLFEAEREWFWAHEQGANAVFQCDLLDSFFQMSPFSLLPDRNLTFFSDRLTLHSESALFQKCCPSPPEKWDRPTVRSEILAGSFVGYLTLVYSFLRSEAWLKCRFPGAEEAIVNRVADQVIQAHSDIEWGVMGCADGVYVGPECGSLHVNSNALIVDENGRVPWFIRPSLAPPELQRHFSSVCPINY